MWRTIGHEKAVSLLRRGLERGKLAHAYLFVGPAHVGKMTLAIDLARALNCESKEPCGKCLSCQKIAEEKHPDVLVVGLIPDEKSVEGKLKTEIGIDQVRQVQHAASLPPFEGRYKIVIVEGAELLSLDAANCLLKTLEEPVGKVVFVLLTANDKLLPATVVSRCQRIELAPLPVKDVGKILVENRKVEPQKANLLARLSHGCPGWAILAVNDAELLQQRTEKVDEMLVVIDGDSEARFACAAQLAARFSQNRAAVQETLDVWTDLWRDLMLVKLGCSEMVTNSDRAQVLAEVASHLSLAQIRGFIESVQKAGEQLRQNVNARLVLDVLMLDMPRREGSRRAKLTAKG